MLTQEKIRRIQQAKAETQRQIDREMHYSEQFRNREFIAEYQAHLNKLNKMLQEV